MRAGPPIAVTIPHEACTPALLGRPSARTNCPILGAAATVFAGVRVLSPKEFLEFVLSKYIETGVEELDQEKLPDLLTLKYQAIRDAEEILGGVDNIRARLYCRD